jgi:hypothetical protein
MPGSAEPSPDKPATFAYQTMAETMFVANVVIPAVMNVAGPDAGPGVKLIDLSNDPALASAGMDSHFRLAESAHVAQLVYQAIMAAGSGAASSGEGESGLGTGGSGQSSSGGSVGANAAPASKGGCAIAPPAAPRPRRERPTSVAPLGRARPPRRSR